MPLHPEFVDLFLLRHLSNSKIVIASEARPVFSGRVSVETSLDRFSISCAIWSFVVSLRDAMCTEDISFRPYGADGPFLRVDAVEAGEMGIHLQLHGVGHYYIQVERIERDTFYRFDESPYALVPPWMTA